MIGRAHRGGTDFIGLGVYLEHGNRETLQPGRVDWIESRNLPTRDPACAARLMAATARDSERVRKPVYHLSISFDPGDPVDRETMRRVADRTLRDLGLQEHQAVLVAHRDRQHPHVHIMVNRVHPERGTAWSNSWDYRRIETSLRQQEVELGLRVVPGKHAPVPENARDRMPERAPERVRGDAAFVERVRAEAGPHLTGARSWAELERGLAGHGLALRMKGRGMVVTDGVREVKASEIDAAASRFRLERRLGSFTDYRARQAVAGQALDERARRVPAQVQERSPAPAAPERGAIPTGINREQRASDVRPAARYRAAARDFSRELGTLYENPARARRAFLRAARLDGRERAARTLHARPETFGAVRDRSHAVHAAEAAARFTAFTESRVRPALRELAGWIREHERTAEWEASTAALTRADEAAQRRAQAAAHARTERRRLAQEVRAGAATVYVSPAHAARRIARAVRRDGVEAAALAVARTPERFGRLRAVERRRMLRAPLRDDSEARTQAVRLAEAVRGAGRAWEAAPRAGEAARSATTASLAGQAVAAARRAAPPRTADEALHAAARLAHELKQAGHDVTGRLSAMLPPQAIPTVRQAVSLGRDLAAMLDPEREHDRGRDGPSR